MSFQSEKEDGELDESAPEVSVSRKRQRRDKVAQKEINIRKTGSNKTRAELLQQLENLHAETFPATDTQNGKQSTFYDVYGAEVSDSDIGHFQGGLQTRTTCCVAESWINWRKLMPVPQVHDTMFRDANKYAGPCKRWGQGSGAAAHWLARRAVLAVMESAGLWSNLMPTLGICQGKAMIALNNHGRQSIEHREPGTTASCTLTRAHMHVPNNILALSEKCTHFVRIAQFVHHYEWLTSHLATTITRNWTLPSLPITRIWGIAVLTEHFSLIMHLEEKILTLHTCWTLLMAA